jgi:urea transport system ATP-binding protein
MTVNEEAAVLAASSVAEATPSEESPPPKPASAERRRSGISLLPRRRTVEKSRYDALTQGRKALLCVDDISVSFDGFKALNQLTLVLDEGELRCIIGPNGAGKTTLMDVITGKTKPDTGTVFLMGDDTDLTQLSEHEIASRGVCRKFQRPTVFQGHTVFENLELALPGNKSVLQSLFARLSKKQREDIERILETIGLKDQGPTRAGLLSHGQKQWLEIGMLLAQEPRVLLVDEPVAGMTHQETERTAELLNSLAGERTVVVVEHDMEFVRSIARTVTVLHEGHVLAEGPMDVVQNDPKVIEVYLGES